MKLLPLLFTENTAIAVNQKPAKNKGMGGHQSANSRTNSYITPKEILLPLGVFDLDPCAAIDQPWPTAIHHFTKKENGLQQAWWGRVWLNPPYSTQLILAFMQKMAQHNNGIALTFARTDTAFFQEYVFPVASSVFFVKRRIAFCTTAGIRTKNDGGAPSVLIAYGPENSEAIDKAGFKGRHVLLNTIPIIIVGISPSWKSVVSIVLSRTGGTAHLQQIYDLVEQLAPDKVQKNAFLKEKIRQTLQQHFAKVQRGIYSNN